MPLREEGSFVGVTASQKQLGSYSNDSEIEGNVSSEAVSMKDNDANLKPCADEEGTHFDFVSSNIDRPERPSADAVSPMPGTRTRVKKMKQKMPPYSESINSVANIVGTSRTSKSNDMQLSQNDEEVNFRSQLPNGKTTMPNDVRPGKLGDKKPVGGGPLPELLIKETSKSRSSLFLTSSRPDFVIKDSRDDSTLSNGKDIQSSSFTAPRTSSAAAGQSHTVSKSVFPTKNNNIPSLPQNACRGFKTSMQKVVQQFRASKPLKSHAFGSETEVAENYNDKVICMF